MAAPNAPAPQLMTVRIIWFALLVSQGIYLVILRMPGVVPAQQVPDPLMLYALIPAALATAVGSFVLPRILAANAAKGATVTTAPIEGTAQSASYRSANLGARGFRDPDAALREALRIGITPFIVGAALNESVAIFGLVLGFLGHPFLAYLPFFVVAVILMLARFPTEAGFLRPLARAHGVGS